MAHLLQVKRIYDPPAIEDGYRILVDRLWPRGMTKERAKLDEWAKEIAPTTELRKWFMHTADRFEDFRKRYWQELDENRQAESFKRSVGEKRKSANVTLLYAARDVNCNHAFVLKEWLEA